MTDVVATIQRNLAHVRERIAIAASQAGRSPGDITLVGVTKYVDSRMSQLLIQAGCCDLGESRPQSLWEKSATLASDTVRWHMIGHLQKNKIRRTLPLIHLLHSGDSLSLLQELNVEAQRQSRAVEVLLEVNISGEPAKTGLAPEELASIFPQLALCTQLRVRGLMAMAGLDRSELETRREFAAVRELRDHLQREAPDNVDLRELSLGMSGDYELAILEGSTMVRVGSALWEGLDA